MTTDEERFDEIVKQDWRVRQAACRILGVTEAADERAVKKAYRRACLRYHPDRHPTEADAHKKFLLVQCAYELLTKNTICPMLLEEMKSEAPALPESKYNLDNTWGLFLWWREQFFGESRDDQS
jgi:hypothetical protein